MKVSIVIPVYYNEDNLYPLYADIKEKFIDKITIIDIMVTIRAIYYINVVKMYTLKAGGTCRREYYPC